MDTDDYFWESTDPPYTTKRNSSERIALMKSDIAKHDKVVISGSLVDWGDELIPFITLAIRVETDTEIRIDRLKKESGRNLETGSMWAEICMKITGILLTGQLLMIMAAWI